MGRSKPNLQWIRALLGDLDDRQPRAVDASATAPTLDACVDGQAEPDEPAGSNLKTIPD
jgi:hypothetical protein